MRVDAVDALATHVAHERFPDLLEDAGLEEPGIERVPKIVEPDVADAGGLQRGSPGGFDRADLVLAVHEDQTGCLLPRLKQRADAGGQWNLSAFALDGFRARDLQDAAGEIKMLPVLMQEFTAPHAGIQGEDEELLHMRRGMIEKLLFFKKRDHRAGSAAFLRQTQPRKRVGGQQPFIGRPVQEMAQDGDVPVDGGLGERLGLMARLAVLADDRLGDGSEGQVTEVRQQDLQLGEVMRRFATKKCVADNAEVVSTRAHTESPATCFYRLPIASRIAAISASVRPPSRATNAPPVWIANREAT